MKTDGRNNLLFDFLKYHFLYFFNVNDQQDKGKLFSAGQELQLQSPLSQTDCGDFQGSNLQGVGTPGME